MTQCDMVIDHLQRNGSITSLKAIQDYGITRLSAVIWLLRHKRGYNIVGRRECALNRFGATTNYMRYVLMEEDNEQIPFS